MFTPLPLGTNPHRSGRESALPRQKGGLSVRRLALTQADESATSSRVSGTGGVGRVCDRFTATSQTLSGLSASMDFNVPALVHATRASPWSFISVPPPQSILETASRASFLEAIWFCHSQGRSLGTCRVDCKSMADIFPQLLCS